MKKILIVEDDPGQMGAMQTKFADLAATILKAKDVQEALVLYRANNPDLIVLDIMLPGGLNGFDFIEQIRVEQIFAPVPIIVATNLNSEAKVAQTMGVAEYFIKAETPIEKLKEIVKNYLQ